NVASGAVRANALVTISAAPRNVVINAFMRWRDYGIAVGVGVGNPIYGKHANGATPEDVRDKLFDWLTTTDVKKLVLAQKVHNATGYGMVISPVTVQRAALIRVLPVWAKHDAPNFSDDAAQRDTFTIRIGADHTEVCGAGLTVTEIRDVIIEELE